MFCQTFFYRDFLGPKLRAPTRSARSKPSLITVHGCVGAELLPTLPDVQGSPPAQHHYCAAELGKNISGEIQHKRLAGPGKKTMADGRLPLIGSGISLELWCTAESEQRDYRVRKICVASR